MRSTNLQIENFSIFNLHLISAQTFAHVKFVDAAQLLCPGISGALRMSTPPNDIQIIPLR